MKPVKILYNAKIYTMDKQNPVCDCVVIKNGKFVFAGNTSKLPHELNKEAYEKIDLKGKCVLPGFIDSHLHLAAYH